MYCSPSPRSFRTGAFIICRMKFLFFLLIIYAQMTLRAQNKTDQNLYSTFQTANTGVLYNPFYFGIDPMERLLLINFEKNPDLVYVGLEPQVFDDSIHGKGMLVIGWRVDGKVDVYHQPGLILDAGKYDIAGKGLAEMAEVPMERAFFEVNAFGVQADIKFNDLAGRPVELKVRESNPRKREPFGLLAPMGDAAESPSAMPLVLLHDFYFVRKKNTEISVSIDGKQHQLDQLPIPMDWSSMYFTRYSPDPFIVTFNPAYEGPLQTMHWEGQEMVNIGSIRLELATEDQVPEIKRLSQKGQHHSITLSFAPAFPNLMALSDGHSLKGTFQITGHPSTGEVGGHYEVVKEAGVTQIVLVPSRGWIPNEKKLSLRFLYTVAKIFKKWPATYKWTATIREGEDNQLMMKSSWERIKK